MALQRSARRTRGARICRAYDFVSDAMTRGEVFTCAPDDSVDSVLEKLVAHRVTGLPVVDAAGVVVGVVSDSDLLALHNLGRVKDDRALFPAPDETWQAPVAAFNAVKKLLAKSSGKRVSDVMTPDPIVVKPTTDLDEAARLLLSKKVHRLPVVDDQGRLLGVLSRGNLVKAALALRSQAAVN
ncbi:MAG: hypothetical protein J3K34DRAFT_463739 [Monoraphidium minutum]|nr:MAG: hypothetical protein J3K34DRAFT_463739 [Monoraphidium minutum]